MVVRTDLPRGIQAAMLVHAAGESSPGGLEDGTYAVVLAVPTEGAINAVSARLTLAGVAHKVIYEPDPPYCGAAMAIGVVPARKEELRRFLSSLPLLK